MWIKMNPNPKRKHVPDCVVRAICIALNMSWYEAYDGICRMGRIDCSMPSDDNVWGHYLLLLGFNQDIQQVYNNANQMFGGKV